MFAKPSPIEIIRILSFPVLNDDQKGKKRREALAMLDKFVTDNYPPSKVRRFRRLNLNGIVIAMFVIQEGGIMNYKDLKSKTVFDFCNDAEILAKVTGFSEPLESKEYIEAVRR